MNFIPKKLFGISFIVLVGIFLGALSFAPIKAQAADCAVTSATFDVPSAVNRNYFTLFSKPKTVATVQTQNCENQAVYFTIMAHFRVILDKNTTVFNQEIIVPATNQFTVTLQTGDEHCDATGSPSDCDFYIVAGPNQITTIVTDHLYHGDYVSLGKTNGELQYDCPGATLCLSNNLWSYISDTGAKEVFDPVLGVSVPFVPKDSGTPPPNTVVLAGGSVVAPGTECADTSTGRPIPGCYEIYSGLRDALGKDSAGNDRFKSIREADSLGAFINAIIAWIIGIGGVLTVVMIMYNGYLYMSERGAGNPGKMNTAKTRIFNSVLGLLLLLTIYTILRTINPDLLNLVPRIDLAQLDPGEQGDGGEDAVATNDDNVGAAPKACPAGLTKVQGFVVCKTIEKKFADMLTAAKSAGITLGGGGYRSTQSQINLRIKNCGGNTEYNIYKKPSTQCVPATAIPGRSHHEAGIAFDFTCNGLGIINLAKRPSTKTCFDWLSVNAGKYGLQNFPRENWHWSVDGH